MRYTINKIMNDGKGQDRLVQVYYTNDTWLVNTAIDNWASGSDFNTIDSSFYQCETKVLIEGPEDFSAGYGSTELLKIYEEGSLLSTIG